MAVEDLDIVFGNPHKTYKAGDKVTGACVFTLSQPLAVTGLLLKFTGKSMVGFSRGKNQNYFATERYFKREVDVMQSQSLGTTLSPGRHEFPFVFQLDRDIPSSFDSFYGHVRYAVQATLQTHSSMSKSVKRFYCVFRPLDLNDFPFSLSARNPSEAHGEKTLCCVCCSYGSISACARVTKSGYVPGETVHLYATVNNDSNASISETYFTLEQVIQYHAMGHTQMDIKFLKSQGDTAVRPAIRAGETDAWSGEHGFVIPITAPSGLDGCNIIDMKYNLVLNVVPSGPATRLKVSVPIFIGTVPLVHNFPGNRGDCDSTSDTREIHDADMREERRDSNMRWRHDADLRQMHDTDNGARHDTDIRRTHNTGTQEWRDTDNREWRDTHPTERYGTDNIRSRNTDNRGWHDTDNRERRGTDNRGWRDSDTAETHV